MSGRERENDMKNIEFLCVLCSSLIECSLLHCSFAFRKIMNNNIKRKWCLEEMVVVGSSCVIVWL